jgi:glycosyltransferase involved in cell wall biosynthesis
MNRSDICVVIPTYNNDLTLATVIDSVLNQVSVVVVVNDGSTDNTENVLSQYKNRIEIVSYAKNRGKGYALKQGFARAEEMNCKYVITLDSDGQHFAEEITLFVDACEKYPEALIIGNRNLKQDSIPSKNVFANKFSNFWFAVQTGIKLSDTQTGYRLYPLERMKHFRPFTSRYEAELEMLVRSAWRGIKLVSIPIGVYYASEKERVTHFRPEIDFFRISLLNTLFVFLAVIYGYPAKFFRFLFKK